MYEQSGGWLARPDQAGCSDGESTDRSGGIVAKPTALPANCPILVPTLLLGAVMNDQAAKLFAGHAGVCAVLVDMLIDKGIVSQGELLGRFERAQSTAGHW